MKNLKFAFLLLATIVMVGCGEDKKEEKESIKLEAPSETSAVSTSTDEPVAANGEIVEVSISGNDQMQFNKNEIRVKAGQTVRLTLNHVGEMSEKVMGHNWVLLKKGTDIPEFGNAAASASENNYIPKGTNNVIANTEMIGGGESVTIEFQVPEKGSYDFICSFPGHYALMKGKFIVE